MSTAPRSLTAYDVPEPAWDIAKLFPPQGSWTVEEYLDFTDETNHLIEFTDGQIEVLEMPTTRHQLILGYLFTTLTQFVKERQLGVVVFAALRVQISDTKFREPDIVFAHKDNRSQVKDRFWTGADLVVEIVSDDAASRQRDLVTKRADYAAAGIAEYWIVDPLEKRITVLALEGDGYATHGEFTLGQQAVSRLLEGFSVDVEATFAAANG